MSEQGKGTAVENEFCAGCLNKLLDEDYISALGQDWHVECFRCSICDITLSSWYFEKNGLLFCQNDYWIKYGEACQRCSQIITGPVMTAGDHRFHPECFSCEVCSAYIGDGEPYALVERSKLFCGLCYEGIVHPLDRSRHAIQLVEIHPQPCDSSKNSTKPFIHLKPDTNGSLTIKHVDVSCGLMALHIGDKILEINGTPIKNQPISQIENLICRSNSVLHLTIEHDPNHQNKKIDKQQDRKEDDVSLTINVNDNTSNISMLPDIIMNCENNEKISHNEIQDTKDKLDEKRSDLINILNIPNINSTKERVFKKRTNDGTSGNRVKSRNLWRKAGVSDSHNSSLQEKDRSSSMSQLIQGSTCNNVSECDGRGIFDLVRTQSFRVDARTPSTVFRAKDLLQGELLGSGFFGQVYKVTHRDTNEIMVLKQLYRVDEDAEKNFLKEVAVLRSLSHPNVLRFVGVLYKEQRLHLVTEYISGGTLRSLLESDHMPPWDERAGYARDISAGLTYLHRMNVIHRDLNSHNCLVKEDKTVIVADFGLARIVKSTGVSNSLERSKRNSSHRRKKRYTVVGNPYWMAPEMMKGNVYDEKVDIFSFGIILCEIIGKVHADPDFLPRSSDFGLNQALFKDKFCHDCPEALYNIAFLCCNINPDRRPPFEIIKGWLESINVHLSSQKLLPIELVLNIKQFCNTGESNSDLTENFKSEFTISISDSVFSNNEKINNDNLCTTNAEKFLPPFPGDIKKYELKPKTRRRGLGPKCISASHLCPPNTICTKSLSSFSKSQNALCSISPGYILSTDNKTINITKVDNVREWLENPIVLKDDKKNEKSTAEKWQPIEDLSVRSIYCKSRRFDDIKHPNKYKYVINERLQEPQKYFKKDKVNNFKILKSKSQNCATLMNTPIVDTPCYLRNQSVNDLETNKKPELKVENIKTNSFVANPRVRSDVNNTSDSDTSDDVSHFAINNLKKDESPLAANEKNGDVLNKVKQLKKQFEHKTNNQTLEIKKNINKILSPKFCRKANNPLTKIFHHNHSNQSNINSKDVKNNNSGKSTFFVTKPQTTKNTRNSNISSTTLCENHTLGCSGHTKCSKLNSKTSKINSCTSKSFQQNSELNLIANIEKITNSSPLKHNNTCNNASVTEKPQHTGENTKEYIPNDSVDNEFRNCTECNKNCDINIPSADKCYDLIEQQSSVPLVRCNNYKNIPLLTSVLDNSRKQILHTERITNDDTQQPSGAPKNYYENYYAGGFKIPPKIELDIPASNYVRFANLKINCPFLNDPDESVKNTEPTCRIHDKNPRSKQCVQSIETCKSNTPTENTSL